MSFKFWTKSATFINQALGLFHASFNIYIGPATDILDEQSLIIIRLKYFHKFSEQFGFTYLNFVSFKVDAKLVTYSNQVLDLLMSASIFTLVQLQTF